MSFQGLSAVGGKQAWYKTPGNIPESQLRGKVKGPRERK